MLIHVRYLCLPGLLYIAYIVNVINVLSCTVFVLDKLLSIQKLLSVLFSLSYIPWKVEKLELIEILYSCFVNI